MRASICALSGFFLRRSIMSFALLAPLFALHHFGCEQAHYKLWGRIRHPCEREFVIYCFVYDLRHELMAIRPERTPSSNPFTSGPRMTSVSVTGTNRPLPGSNRWASMMLDV